MSNHDELGGRLSEQELCPSKLLAEQEAAFQRDIARLHARSDEFVDVACPACAGLNGAHVFKKYNFSFRKCSDCQTIFMSPRPSEGVLSDYYSNSENYAYWAKFIFPASESSRKEKIHKPWLKRVLSYCEEFNVKRDLLLEIGPGFGTFCAVATEAKSFKRVVGVEPTPELAQACRDRGVEVVESRVEDLDDNLIGADVVVAFEVIEHLFDPRAFLQGIRSKMNSGGLLILSCPNGLGFDIAMLKEKALAVDAEHVNLFNPESLTGLLKAVGFDVVRAHTPGRLDAEFVRDGALNGDISLDPFLQKVLVDEWETLGWPFQQFLASNGLSSHMWIVSTLR